MCAVGVYTGRGMATRAGVALACFAINALYKVCCLLPRRDEVLFFSRQANEPSGDFAALGMQFESCGWRPVYLTKKLSARSAVPYVLFAAREIYHLARCRICIVDRYDPVISLADMCCERVSVDQDLGDHGLPVFSEFPVKPLVIQVWHAFGAFKKFGYQSLGTPESHPAETARIFRIHRNFSWILCSGEGARKAFAEAFNVPVERVVALPRPEFFRLRKLSGDGTSAERDLAETVSVGEAAAEGVLAGDSLVKRLSEEAPRARKPRVLFAPTLRKNHGSRHPLRALYDSGEWRALESFSRVTWAFHPLESTGLAPADVNEELLRADYVVTDYSSVAYEAYLLGKRVMFYVPDLKDYRISPGLNADPGCLCPDLCLFSADELIERLFEYVSGVRGYPAEQFESFAGRAFDGEECPTSCIVDFALSLVR